MLEPTKLTLAQTGFAHEYATNGNNATTAYQAAYPGTKQNSASTSGWRLLRNVKVAALVEQLTTERWARLAMRGDEALGRLALDARADIRRLFNAKNEVLPVLEWPTDVAQSVRSLKAGPFGMSITMNDSFAARRYLAEQSGASKHPLTAAAGELARLLTRDFPEGE